MSPLFAWLAAVNVLAFVLFGLDKWFAVRGMWRISERTLFTVALLGGTAGALLGIPAYPHTPRHKTFTLGMPAILLLQSAPGIWLWKAL